MRRQTLRVSPGLVALVGLALAGLGSGDGALAGPAGVGVAMEQIAEGTFTVRMTPTGAGGEAIGEMRLEKEFSGGLVGRGSGRMLTRMTPVEASAAYVALEEVTGTLGGRAGSFSLQHMGTMDEGRQSLAIRVVPDSGAGGLVGIRGEMEIRIEGGTHFYTLRYRLPAPR